LHPYELRLELRLAVFKKHGYDFLKTALKLVQALALAVGAGPARHMADEQPRVGIPLDDNVEASHAGVLTPRIRPPRLLVHPEVDRTPGISCKAPIRSGFVSFIPLFDRPFLLRKILKSRAATTSQSHPSLTDLPKELGMVLEPVLEPILF
jgi:hypothetical protein